MATVKHVSYYTNVMQQWGKQLGPKPTEAELALAHVFGRPGKQSLAVALALRDGGVTGAQIKAVSALVDGKPTPQLNHMRALVNAKMFTRQPVPGAYALVKGPNADRFIDLHGAKAAAEAKPAKVKAAKKPRKAKAAKPAELPVSETAPAEAVAEVQA